MNAETIATAGVTGTKVKLDDLRVPIPLYATPYFSVLVESMIQRRV